MLLPIFIQQNDEPETCPKCHKEEDTALVCRHCGHEYETEDEGGIPVWVTLFITTFIILFVIHFCIWALASANGDTQMTYWQAVVKTFRYLWERIITRIF